MPKKTKTKVQKEMNSSVPNYKQKVQWNVEKASRPDKIRPKDIFEMNNPKKTKSRSSTRKRY